MNKTLRLVERLELLRRSGDVGTFGEETATYVEFVRLWREDALDDADLERALQMVEAAPDATAMIRGIRDMSTETPGEARVVLSTVHQMWYSAWPSTRHCPRSCSMAKNSKLTG